MTQNRPKHQWTQEEKDYIRVNYQGNQQSAKSLAATIGVSDTAVKGQLSAMSVRRRAPHRRWTKQDEQQLETLAHTHPPHVIAKKMNRSTDAVIVRMKKRRLLRRNRDAWYTATDAAQVLGRDPKWVTSQIANGKLKASKHHQGSEKANGTGQSPWHIRPKDLKNFIRAYPQDLQGRNIDIVAVVDLLAGVTSSAA